MFQECEQREGWAEVEVPSNTDPEKVYVCTLPPWERTAAEVVCECEGYIRRGKCSHQALALAKICDWSALTGPEQIVSGKCPLCGGPTRMVL